MRIIAKTVAFLVCSCVGRRVHLSRKQFQKKPTVGDGIVTLESDGYGNALRHLATYLQSVGSAVTSAPVRRSGERRHFFPAWLGRHQLGWDSQIGRLMLHMVEQLAKPATKLIEALPALTFFPEKAETMEAGNHLLSASATVTRLKIDGFNTIRPFEVKPSSKRRVDTVSSFGKLNIAMFMDVTTIFGGPLGKNHSRSDKLVLRTDIEDCRIQVTWKFGFRPGAIRSLLEGSDYDQRVWDAKLHGVNAKVNGDLNMRLERAYGDSSNKNWAPPGVWQVLSKAASHKLKELVETSMEESVQKTIKENFSDLLDDIAPSPEIGEDIEDS